MNLSLWRIKRRGDREYHGFRIPVWVPVAGVTVSVLFLLLQIYDLVLT